MTEKEQEEARENVLAMFLRVCDEKKLIPMFCVASPTGSVAEDYMVMFPGYIQHEEVLFMAEEVVKKMRIAIGPFSKN